MGSIIDIPCNYKNIFKGGLRIVRARTSKGTQLKFYKAVVPTALLCGSKSWTNKTRYINKIQSLDMRYFRALEDCSRLGSIKDTNIM